MNGDFIEVENLLNSGEHPNSINFYGETPLTIAISYEQTQLIPLLIEYGADPTLTNMDGWTAIDYAEYYGLDNIYQLLITYY